MSCVAYVVTAIISLNPSWDESKAKQYAEPICVETKKHDIDPLVVVSIIHHESNWNPRARGRNNNGSVDLGLMQFNCTSLDKINMSWRKWWCNPKRRGYLRSVKGNIRAGVRLLSMWKGACDKKHGHDTHVLAPFEEGCDGCFRILRKNHPSKYLDKELLLRDVLGNHWWVQHYNWYSKGYAKRILYTYLALRFRQELNYEMLRNRRYKRYAKDRCLVKEDLCFSEYQEKFVVADRH